MRLTRNMLFLAAMAAISCRSEDDGSPGTPDAAVSAGTTVKAFLNTNPATETMVTLDRVVVVSHVSSSSDGKIWVQDPGGGAQSGMMLFCDFDSSTQMCPMSRADVDALQIGDVLAVDGRFVKVFSNRVNQITAPHWTKKGTMAPVATVVPAAEVAKGAEAGARKWESVYVKVAKPATMSNFMADEFKNTSCTPPRVDGGAPATADAGPAGTFYDRGFEVEADGQTLAIGFKLYNTLDYCLADCGYCQEQDMIVESDSFSSVSGVVYFERGNSINFLELRPTKNDDLPRQ